MSQVWVGGSAAKMIRKYDAKAEQDVAIFSTSWSGIEWPFFVLFRNAPPFHTLTQNPHTKKQAEKDKRIEAPPLGKKRKEKD